MTGGARRDRGPPLLARGHPWGAELAHWLGRPWVGIQDEGAQRSGPASPQVAVVVSRKGGLQENFWEGES